jgi:hypothetical protein
MTEQGDTCVVNTVVFVYGIRERVAEVKRADLGRIDETEVLRTFEEYLVESRGDAGQAAWWRRALDMAAIVP